MQGYTGFAFYIKLLMGAFAEPRWSNIIVMVIEIYEQLK